MSTRTRQAFRVGIVLILLQGGTVFATEDSVQTAALVNYWPVTEGGNGHAYQPVATWELIPWTSAAQAASLAGGYLATTTSEAENDFVFALSSDFFVQAMGNYYGPWLGGYQLPGSAEPASGWVWVTDEPFEYTAWASGEPSQTAGALNEDRIHYLGHGEPQPLWNDQTNVLDFGPMAYVVEYDPVTWEAEDATELSGGRVETDAAGCSGSGCVRLEGEANAIRWTVNVGWAGPKALLLRYSNGTLGTAGLEVIVNGVVAESNLLCSPTGAWDAWGSVATKTRLRPGDNAVEVRSITPEAGLKIDKMTVFGEGTNLALNRRITSSSETPMDSAAQAVDADTQTSWQPESLPQWLEVDLGDVYPLYRTQVVCSLSQVCQFRVEVKARAEEAYVQVVDRTENTVLGTALEPIVDMFEPTPARYVRLTVTGGSWGAPAIAEFRLSAATGQTPAIAIGSKPYATIQAALDAAQPGDVIVVQPGQYSGAGNQGLTLKGKGVTLTSIDPNDSQIVAATVIRGTNAGPAVRCLNEQDTQSVLAGLTITGAQMAIQCEQSAPTIRNCRIVGNGMAGIELYRWAQPTIRNCLIAGNRGVGISMDTYAGLSTRQGNNAPQIVNCTITENLGGGVQGGAPTIINSILYGNGASLGGKQINSPSATVSYSDVQGGWPGEGNLDVDPCFARPGAWTGAGDTPWIEGDYHLQSQAGRWDGAAQAWVVDSVTSPCIDAGAPAGTIGAETIPNGGQLNLGVYGGTREAGRSPQLQ